MILLAGWLRKHQELERRATELQKFL